MSAEWMTRVIVAGVAATATLSMLTDGAASAEKKYKGTPYKWGGSAPQAGKGTDPALDGDPCGEGRHRSRRGKRPAGGSDRTARISDATGSE